MKNAKRWIFALTCLTAITLSCGKTDTKDPTQAKHQAGTTNAGAAQRSECLRLVAIIAKPFENYAVRMGALNDQIRATNNEGFMVASAAEIVVLSDQWIPVMQSLRSKLSTCQCDEKMRTGLLQNTDSWLHDTQSAKIRLCALSGGSVGSLATIMEHQMVIVSSIVSDETGERVNDESTKYTDTEEAKQLRERGVREMGETRRLVRDIMKEKP
jgi:hypothetical protein